MVQMKICGLKSKVLTKKNVEKPDLVFRFVRSYIEYMYKCMYYKDTCVSRS